MPPPQASVPTYGPVSLASFSSTYLPFVGDPVTQTPTAPSPGEAPGYETPQVATDYVLPYTTLTQAGGQGAKANTPSLLHNQT